MTISNGVRISKTWLVVIVAAVVLLILVLVFRKSPSKKVESVKISNFQDCVQAGYKVKEGLPRECATPDGQIFIETQIQQSKPAASIR